MKFILAIVGSILSAGVLAGSLVGVRNPVMCAAFAAVPPALHVQGRHLVDPEGYCVRLMGTMRSIHPYFDGGRWGWGHDAAAAKRAYDHYEKVFSALADRKQGSYCNMVRLTDDGHWSNDDKLKPDKKSPHFYACDWTRYEFYVNEVLVPIVENAVKNHGLYIIIRPSYNNPGDTRVDDAFNHHLRKEWKFLASHPKLQALSGQVLFELQNEPTRIRAEDGSESDAALTRFMQPLVDTVRAAGFKGVILAPGLGYQSWYEPYMKHPLKDRNLGYAVHVYSGWYGQSDDNADLGTFVANFRRQVPVVMKAPCVVTEVDWSPIKPGKGKTNEFGQFVPANWGTWATASTSKWGKTYFKLLECFGNVSTLAGDSHCYHEIDEYLKTGRVVMCFGGEKECCSYAFFKLFARWTKAPREKPQTRDEKCRRALNPPGKYRNPIIYADCPDMGLCCDGTYYYMVSTTMHLMPGASIMRSKDMITWETVGYAIDRFEEKPDFSLEDGKTAYGGGQWASSLRYHKGRFYLWFIANGSGGYLYTAKKAEGPWKLETRGPFLHDGSVLFDDDGKVYVFHGSGHVTEMKDDFSGPKPGGLNRQLFERGDETALLEGSAAFKRDGTYYLMMVSAFLPGHPRREVCYRAKSLTGPWEKKVVLETKFDDFGGVGQGCVVQGPDKKWRALVFQDRGGIGRVPCLMDVRWEDGWPMLGTKEGTVPSAKICSYPDLSGIAGSDDFNAKTLSLKWQWNHNPVDAAWSLTARKGFLTLKTPGLAPNLFQARNTLTQRMVGPECTGVVKLDVAHMKDGDHAGFAAFQGDSAVAEVVMERDKRRLVLSRQTVKFRHEHGAKTVEDVQTEEFASVDLPGTVVWLRVEANFHKWQDWATVSYSTDGKTWSKPSPHVPLRFDTGKFFMGSRFAIFNYATKTPGGSVAVDYFRTRATEHD